MVVRQVKTRLNVPPNVVDLTSMKHAVSSLKGVSLQSVADLRVSSVRSC